MFVLIFIPSNGGRVFFAIFVVLLSLMGYVMIRPALSWVRLTGEALEVYNWPFDHVVNWSDVTAVGRRWRGSIAITRPTGRRLTSVALSGNPMYDLSWRDSTVAEIHGRATAART